MSAITNGTLITKNLAKRLLELNFRWVQITLDGPKHIHNKKRIYKNGKGSYDDIIGTITLLKDLGLPPSIRINVDSESFSHLDELLDDLKAKGLQDCRLGLGIIKGYTETCASYLYNVPNEKEADMYLKSLYLMREKGFSQAIAPITGVVATFCSFLTDIVFAIDPFGDVYKCLNFIGMKEFRAGSIDKDGTLRETPFYYEWMSRNPFLMKQCEKCKILPLCWGGCPAVAYMEKKRIDVPGCLPRLREMNKRIMLYLRLYHPSKIVNDQFLWQKHRQQCSKVSEF